MQIIANFICYLLKWCSNEPENREYPTKLHSCRYNTDFIKDIYQYALKEDLDPECLVLLGDRERYILIKIYSTQQFI